MIRKFYRCKFTNNILFTQINEQKFNIITRKDIKILNITMIADNLYSV